MEDGPDIMGPGKIRVFAYLLIFTVMMLAVGEVIAVAYGVTFIRDFTKFFAERPETLLGIAGFIAIGGFAIRAAGFLEQVGGR